MSDLTDILTGIKLTCDPVTTHNGDTFYRHDYKVIPPQQPTAVALLTRDGSPVGVQRLADLIALIKYHRACELPLSTIIVALSESGGWVRFCEVDYGLTRDRSGDPWVWLPYHITDHSGALSFEALHELLRGYAGRIDDEAVLRSQLRELTTVDSTTLELSEDGGHVTTTATARRGLKPYGVSVPQRITLSLPTGFRDVVLPNHYSVHVIAKEPRFALKLDRDTLFTDYCRHVETVMNDACLEVLDGVRFHIIVV